MYKEPKVYSSYRENNIGQSLYDIVIKLKPEKVIDFGILNVYSTICLAQAMRDNGFGKIIAYDLFDSYEYKHSDKEMVENNLKHHDLEKYVTLKKMDFYYWLDNYTIEFDLLHLDISNDGDIISKMYDKYPNSKVIFEGGSIERDNIDWMVRYKKTKITLIQTSCKYKIINDAFPSLSGYNV